MTQAERRLAAERLFRKAALERLSSPEQLDAPITLDSSGRTAGFVGGLLVGASLLVMLAVGWLGG